MLDKTIKNHKGAELAFSEEYEKACRKYFSKSENEPLTEKELFQFFHDCYAEALNKAEKELKNK